MTDPGENNVLVIVSRKQERAQLTRRLNADPQKFHVVAVSQVKAAASLLRDRPVHAVVCDLELFANTASLVATEFSDERAIPLIVLGPEGTEDRLAVALSEGAAGFLVKTGDYSRLLPAVVEQVLYAMFFWEEVGRIVHHQINNPLTGILGNAELILASEFDLSEEVKTRATTIIRSAVRLRDSVKTLEEMLQGRSWQSGTTAWGRSGWPAIPPAAGPRRS